MCIASANESIFGECKKHGSECAIVKHCRAIKGPTGLALEFDPSKASNKEYRKDDAARCARKYVYEHMQDKFAHCPVEPTMVKKARTHRSRSHKRTHKSRTHKAMSPMSAMSASSHTKAKTHHSKRKTHHSKGKTVKVKTSKTSKTSKTHKKKESLKKDSGGKRFGLF